MDLALALLLAYVGAPAGVLLMAIGGLMARRGSQVWQGVGWALVFAGLGLALYGGYIFVELSQANFGL